jgi:hypothetical protein
LSEFEVDVFRKAFLTLIFLIGILYVGKAQAEKKVYWGGVGFVSWEDRKERYPYSSQLLCAEKKCPAGDINNFADKYFLNANFKNFTYLIDMIGVDEVEGIIMSPMIMRETLLVVEDNTAGKKNFIHQYRIFANLMFFEFGTGRFIASQPVVVQLLDVLDHIATDEENLKVISDLLGSETHKVNVFKSLLKASRNINISDDGKKYVKIRKVKLGDTVKEIVAKKFNPITWKAQIGQIFEANLITQTGAPIIPSMSEEQLEGELIAKFADGLKTIKLPEEPAFQIELSLDKFKLFEKISPPQKNCLSCGIVHPKNR